MRGLFGFGRVTTDDTEEHIHLMYMNQMSERIQAEADYRDQRRERVGLMEEETQSSRTRRKLRDTRTELEKTQKMLARAEDTIRQMIEARLVMVEAGTKRDQHFGMACQKLLEEKRGDNTFHTNVSEELARRLAVAYKLNGPQD